MISDEDKNWLDILPWRKEKDIESSLQDYHKIIKHFTVNSLYKSKIYLKPNEKPPEGVRVQRGPRGGLYYEEEKVVPKRPLAGRSLAVKPLIELPLKLSDIPEITSFYAKYSSEKTAFGQLMACYDAWEWFKHNKAKLSDEQQKDFTRMHAKLNGPVRKILINEINASQEKKEPKIDYAKKYHFYPEAFGCTENELSFVSDLIMSGVPVNKLNKRDDTFEIVLGITSKTSEDFVKSLENEDILEWEYYSKGQKTADLYFEDSKARLINYLRPLNSPIGVDQINVKTKTTIYNFYFEPNSSFVKVQFNNSFANIKQLKKIFKFDVDLPEYVDDISQMYIDADFGTENDAKDWTDSWLCDTGGFSGIMSRIAIGIQKKFSLLESCAVSFSGQKPSPAYSMGSLNNWTGGYSENKKEWLIGLRMKFGGLKRLHKDTQSFLETDKKYKKKDTITIYRGIGKHTNRRLFDGKFDESEVWVPPISSWTESSKIAKSFAQEADGNVLTAEVPKSWVIAHWKTSPGYQQGGFYNPVTKQYRLKTQKEVTIMSPKNKIKCSKIVRWDEMEE